MNRNLLRETNERLFVVSMYTRMGYGVVRIFMSIVLLQLVGSSVSDILTRVMGGELVEDPHDLFYTLSMHILGIHPVEVSYFAAVYLLFWGIIDTILSYNLLKHRMWAFPVSFFLIPTFIFYELIRVSHTHSLILLGIILLDLAILWITWREYVRLKRAAVIRKQ